MGKPGGVENRRSSCSLPVARGAAFASPPQSGLTWLCFLFPLIAPDVRISRIRRSEKAHEFAHGRLAVRSVRLTKPCTLENDAVGKRFVPGHATWCLAHSH